MALVTATSLDANPVTCSLQSNRTVKAAVCASAGPLICTDGLSESAVRLRVLEAVLSCPAVSVAAPVGTLTVTAPLAAGVMRMV